MLILLPLLILLFCHWGLTRGPEVNKPVHQSCPWGWLLTPVPCSLCQPWHHCPFPDSTSSGIPLQMQFLLPFRYLKYCLWDRASSLFSPLFIACMAYFNSDFKEVPLHRKTEIVCYKGFQQHWYLSDPPTHTKTVGLSLHNGAWEIFLCSNEEIQLKTKDIKKVALLTPSEITVVSFMLTDILEGFEKILQFVSFSDKQDSHHQLQLWVVPWLWIQTSAPCAEAQLPQCGLAPSEWKQLPSISCCRAAKT